jgi:thiamine kinase-like enzyme
VVDELEAAQIPMPIVFGHHDLLPANLIDDGEKLWLIDWEYAAFGTPLFDLANLADNAGFSAEEERRLLALYFRREPDAALERAFAATKVASALRETLWAFVSELHLSAPGADYAAYGQTCLARFEAALSEYQRTS